MPIKIKKFDIQNDTEIPKPGYIFLGFDESGELVQKDEYGVYKKVVSSESGTTFDSIITPYLTVGGTRVTGFPWGIYTIAQGTANICVGDTSFVRGRYSQTYGKYSLASGEYVSASGTSSYAWGSGINSSAMLISNGINSFVHQYCITDTAGSLSDYSVILGGYDNDIGSACDSSVILGGNNNLISNSPRSMIIGGINNHLTNLTNTFFIGREDLTTATYSNAVYVPKLCLDTNLPYFIPDEDGVIWYDSSGGGDVKVRINGIDKSMAVDTTYLVTTNTTQSISGAKSFITNSPTFYASPIFNATSIFNNDSQYYSNIIFNDDGCEIKSNDNINYNLTLRTGDGQSVGSGTAGNAGTLYIKGGNGGVSSSGSGVQGNGGNLIISGGAGGVYGSNSGKGGIVTISGGTGDFLKGGNVEIYGGKTNQLGRGGDIIINTPSNYQTGNIYISTTDAGYSGGDILIRPGLGPSSNGTLYIGNVSSPNESYKYKLHVSGHTVHNGVIYNYEYSNRTQFIGNWNQNLNDNWGIGTDGTTNSVIKLGRCDHLGVWNSSLATVKVTGNIELSKMSAFNNNSFEADHLRLACFGDNGQFINMYSLCGVSVESRTSDGSCSYSDKGNNITSVERSGGAGRYTINITYSFTSYPTVCATIEHNDYASEDIISVISVTTNQIKVYIHRYTGGGRDRNFHLLIMGGNYS